MGKKHKGNKTGAKMKAAIEDLDISRDSGRKALRAIQDGEHKEFMDAIRALKMDFKVARNSLLSAFLEVNPAYALVNGQLIATSTEVSDDDEPTDTEIQGKICKLNNIRREIAKLNGETRPKEEEVKQIEESIPLNPPFAIPTEIKTLEEMGIRPMSSVTHTSISNYEDDSYSEGGSFHYDENTGQYITETEFDTQMMGRGYVKVGKSAWSKVEDGCTSYVSRGGYS